MNNIRIIDLLSGKTIWSYYKLYKQTQWYSKEQMEELQLHKLKKLLTHCYDNVEYYRNIIQKNNINIINIESINIIEQFPILTKEIIQENYNAFIPRNNKKIKGVDHRHGCNQLHFDMQAGNLFRKYQACNVIAKRILLPVEEVLATADF